MMSTDPIADMLTRIRNAVAVQKHFINVPYSNIKQKVAEVLKDNNFVEDIAVSGESGFKTLTITINNPDTNSRITAIERMSKPGRRLYSPANTIPKVKNGRGMVIISTSQGIMSGAQAKEAGLGGELICKIY